MFTLASVPRALREEDIHVWYFKVDKSIENPILSPDEQTRANRLRIETKRQQFITTRHITRKILSTYLQISPETVHFSYNEHGKPLLNRLNFNLSHTDNHAILAVSKYHAVGIDIEQLRTVESYDFIRETAFTPHENHTLDQLPEKDKQLAFWRCWTRKEALMKGIGIGFRIAKHLTVSLTETPLVINNQVQNAGDWHLYEYHKQPDLIISLATNPDTHTIQTLIYED